MTQPTAAGLPRPGSDSLRIWTLSNALSMLRLLLAVPLVLLLQDPVRNRWLVVGITLLAYVTDLSDGAIARRFGQESSFGRIIDPLADKVFITAFVVSLLIARMIPPWYVAFVVGRDALIFSLGIVLRGRTGILAQSTMTGKAAVVTVGAMVLWSLFGGMSHGVTYRLGLLASLGSLAASLYVYGMRFIRLYSQTTR